MGSITTLLTNRFSRFLPRVIPGFKLTNRFTRSPSAPAAIAIFIPELSRAMNQSGDAPNVAIEPAPFIDNPRLWEGLPSQTNRYDDVFAGPRAARTMIPGTQSALLNVDVDSGPQLIAVPDGWVEYIHPVEGRPYFYNSELRVVTETYIRHPNQLTYIIEWYTVFRELRNRVLPSAADLDVFLDCDGRNTCRYYIIDHANRTLCWLRQRQTSDIGIADVRSVLGLRALLFEEYWTHLEYVPKNENHLGAVRSELQGALASCLLDHMTSEGSTSPFTKTECESYLLSLNQAADSGHMLYLNWSIVHNRNVNLYGQYRARLDRTTTVEGRHHPPRSGGYTYKSVLLGGGSVINDLTEELSIAGVGVITKTTYETLGIGTGVFPLHMIRERLEGCSKYPIKTGGSGEIYLGRISGTRSPIAIKIPKWKKDSTDEERAETLKYAMHESLIWAMCNHPNVHQFLGVAEYRGRFAQISPLMPRDLGQLLSLESYPRESLYDMCLQICDGVAYLHESGIVHGDLKSGNILVSEDYILKIMDFGNARSEGGRWDSLISKRISQFSLRWAPREMLEENPRPTKQGDVHSLGMTLHEVTSGSVPYAGTPDLIVCANIMRGVLPSRPKTPSQSPNKQEDLLWALLLRCWALETVDRPTASVVRDKMCSISS
ncbi:hypothetical protein RSAG8_12883, partial [Rhizoctonia solani AG-8 WAC10335]